MQQERVLFCGALNAGLTGRPLHESWFSNQEGVIFKTPMNVIESVSPDKYRFEFFIGTQCSV